MNSRVHDVFPVFFAVWALLAIVGAMFFYGGENAALKRRLYPFYIALISVLFIGFTYLIQGQLSLFMLVMVVIIAIFNLRTIRFCDACGRMIMPRSLFVAPKYCQGCGAKLDEGD